MFADVLIIDDEVSVLRGLRRTFRGDFSIETAENGDQALATVEAGWKFKVVVCDQRMHGIDGITTLSRIREHLPATPGILLTGHADIDTLSRAINEASVFKVIEKPCTRKMLEDGIVNGLGKYEASLQQTRAAEKTVLGALKMVERILEAFDLKPGSNRAHVLNLARVIAAQTKCAKPWEMKAALMMADLNQLHLEADRLYNRDVDRLERLAFVNEVFENIPRLSHVAEGLYFKDKNFDGTGIPRNLLSGDGIPEFARALHVILEFERLIDQGLGVSEAVADMKGRLELFDPLFLNALSDAIAEQVDVNRAA